MSGFRAWVAVVVMMALVGEMKGRAVTGVPQSAEVIASLYDQLSAVVEKQLSQPFFLSVYNPGQPLNPDIFENAWSPYNPNGSKEATEVFSRFVDVAPSLSSEFVTKFSFAEVFGLLLEGDSKNPDVKQKLANAQVKYKATEYPSTTDPGVTFHATFPKVKDWFHTTSRSWIRFQQTYDLTNLTYVPGVFGMFGGESSFGYGLWKVGSGGFSEAAEVVTSSVTVGFDMMYVAVERPWFSPGVFQLDSFSVHGYPKNSFSNGFISLNNTQGILPLYPAGFIVIKNLDISGDWLSQDVSLINKSLRSGSTFAFGPFALAGTDSTGSRSPVEFDGIHLTAPGLQIVGWVSLPVPPLPPL